MRLFVLAAAVMLALSPTAVTAAQPTSQLSEVLSAAIYEFAHDGTKYRDLYAKYMGIAPRLVPIPQSHGRWIPVREVAVGSTLDFVLRRKQLRIGWVNNPPYHYRDASGRETGFDVELGAELLRRMQAHYPDYKLTLEWVERKADDQKGDPQKVNFDTLYKDLAGDYYDVILSGLMEMPDRTTVVATIPTMQLFTSIFYTGRDGLDLKQVQSRDRQTLLQWLAQNKGREFTFYAADNPGPSKKSMVQLVDDLRAAGGQAASTAGTEAGDVEAMRSGSVHFVVGDSIALSAVANEPGFKGLNLDIPLNEDKLYIAGYTMPDVGPTSQLAQVISAAYEDVARHGSAYSELYNKYLGVKRSGPTSLAPADWIRRDAVIAGSTLDKVLKSGVLRFGFYRHAPYYFTGSDGKDAGFEYELGNLMAKSLQKHYPGLKVQWVEKKIVTSGGGQDNIEAYEKMLPFLQNAEVDALFSGLIMKPGRPVSAANPDIFFYFDAIYTGKDGWDLQSIQSTNRDAFIKFLVGKPGAVIVSTQGGPSEETAALLVRDVNAAGGSISNKTVSIKDLITAIETQSAHFAVGDAIALSDMAMRPGFKGLNLDLSLRPGGEWMAPMTLPDPVKP
jgi:membrane-bound lytic murein transglycosylase MltF